jgi:lysophospholipase L1-like esterase
LSYFDSSKINAVNAARGGRSSRTFITDGSFQNVLNQVKPGDIVLIQFGHNDVFPINDNVARGTLHGLGEETVEIDNVATGKHEVVHTFGWYMRRMVTDIRTKGATPILLTLTVRDRFNPDGTIERLPDPKVDLADTNRFTAPPMWSVWTADVAKSQFVPLLDVHNKIADRDDQQGRAVAETYYNTPRDPTHRNAKGAAADAEDTLSCLRTLEGSSFDEYLSDAGKGVPAADEKYVIRNDDPLAMAGTRRPFEIMGNLDNEQDSPDTPRTGKYLIVLAGDSTVTYSAGWAAGFKTHLDPQVQVINLSRGGRTTATFRSDGRWDQMLALKPDYVLIQFGHNDEGFMPLSTYSANLARFVDEARAAGVKPILVTPVSRRYWQADNKIHSELGPSADAMKKVAADKNVPLLDLHSGAIELYEKAGKDVTDTWALSKANTPMRRTTTRPATNPTAMPDEVLDKTHFNAQGSKAIGAVVAAKLKELVPELGAYID